MAGTEMWAAKADGLAIKCAKMFTLNGIEGTTVRFVSPVG